MLERERWIQGLCRCGARASPAALASSLWGIAVAQARFHVGRWRKAAGEDPPHHPTKSVVLLVQDRFPVPAQAFEEFAIGFNHLIQAANVGMHVAAPLDDSRQVFLNISPQTWPVGGAAAEGWQILKIRMTRG